MSKLDQMLCSLFTALAIVRNDHPFGAVE
jgi:hypothetical protein